MALEEDVVTAAWVVFAAEEVVKADLVKRCGARIGGDMSAHADTRTLCAMDHNCRIPADPLAVAALNVLIAWEFWLHLSRDGVDEVCRGQRR